MTFQVIGADALRRLVCFEDLIEPVSRAFQQSSAGEADNGLIVAFPLADRTQGDVYVKTGTLRGHSVYIVKVSPWFAANLQQGQPQGGFMAVFDSATGHTRALLDEQHYLSDIRTAAAGALAARALAPAEVTTVTVVGAGAQAYWQVRALHRERPFAILQIVARDHSRAQRLGARLTEALPALEVRFPDLESGVRSADVVITATSAREPFLDGSWLRAGQHITAVGADDPSKCELSASALRQGEVFVDSIETATHNGDVYQAIAAARYQPQLLAGELGDVLASRRAGRTSADQITIAKFVGIGAQDLVAAEVALEKLSAAGYRL